MAPKDVHVLTLGVCYLMWQQELCRHDYIQEKGKIIDHPGGPGIITLILIRKDGRSVRARGDATMEAEVGMM